MPSRVGSQMRRQAVLQRLLRAVSHPPPAAPHRAGGLFIASLWPDAPVRAGRTQRRSTDYLSCRGTQVSSFGRVAPSTAAAGPSRSRARRRLSVRCVTH